MILRLTLSCCLLAAPASAQIGSGLTLPAGCSDGGGALFYLTSGDAGIYTCASGAWVKQSSGGGGAAWGGITGTLSAQTDLQTALDGKQIAGSYLAPSGNGGSLTGLTKAQVGLGNVDNTSDLSKNVSSASTLTTPRAINGVNFDGSAAITVTAAAGTLTGNTLASGVTASSLTSLGAAATLTTTGSLGYMTGAGGAVTQLTNKSTGVTLNKQCGDITMNGAALAAAAIVSFTLTNSFVAAADSINFQHQATGTFGAYNLNGRAAAGSAVFSIRNNSAGSLSEAIVIRFCVIKGAVS